MEDTPTYEELAGELMRELFSLGSALTPMMVNSTRGETATLMTLYRRGAALTPGELAEQAHVTSARVANILRALEEKGLVERAHSSVDRRQVEVTLTDAGQATAERVREERTQAIAGYLRQLGSEDAAHLVRIVRRTTDILKERSERAGSEGGAA